MIDLFSDTVTRPTLAMRSAMAEAEVGDEQRGEDPTTRRLEERAAELLGQETATFLPSATMANAIAIQLFCGPGDEILSAENGHVLNYEAGGAAVHARASVRSIPTWTGVFGRNAVLQRLRHDTPHAPRPRLVVVENTTNAGGGRPWPVDECDGVLQAAHQHGLRVHLDGSRLFNASVALGLPSRRLGQGFDSVTLCLSKGLGCPVGALLAHGREWSGQVRRLKQLMGGAMRQSGILSAAGLYALEHHIERLAQDHRNAQALAEGLERLSQLVIEKVPLRTNMVYFEVPDRYSPDRLEQELLAEGVRLSRIHSRRFRAVTHLDIDSTDIERALAVFRSVCNRI
ncbi:MAG: aminotransferase class I/II-fold pyridoxal phosphate-dependent enzyme [Candidatus Eremiobacteraeota bacterium]|nr:aminotransferase class I/II-fold pyridoxal phosphate-dependent enzyme [Candidatus Eremiobacteraeota bacterium]MCW5868675.1 aminotransferase class I/II-fold pyridoxal phosphate-dependent enzyme [Candidatus Eremiobacteraeota bacterium]